MERIRVTNNFMLDELVDPYTYFNDIDNGLARLDMKAVDCLQYLRELKGSSLRVNNWWKMYLRLKDTAPLSEVIEMIEKSRSVSKFSGFRPEHCNVGAKKSAHRKGKAFDPKGDQFKLYQLVHDNSERFYSIGLRRLENPEITKGWLHMDTSDRNHRDGYIRVVNWASHSHDIRAV